MGQVSGRSAAFRLLFWAFCATIPTPLPESERKEGKAPISWIKVALVVIVAIIVLAVAFWLFSEGDAGAALNLYRAVFGV